MSLAVLTGSWVLAFFHPVRGEGKSGRKMRRKWSLRITALWRGSPFHSSLQSSRTREKTPAHGMTKDSSSQEKSDGATMPGLRKRINIPKCIIVPDTYVACHVRKILRKGSSGALRLRLLPFIPDGVDCPGSSILDGSFSRRSIGSAMFRHRP